MTCCSRDVSPLTLQIDEQAPWLPIAHSTVVLPMSKKVKNYVMEPLGSHRFKNVDLDE